MKKVRYNVAVSLDGYISGPNGEVDWILPDPEVDFAALWAQFDTLLMGRKTYDVAKMRLGEAAFKGRKVAVVSRTMKPSDHPTISIISELTRERVKALRAEAANDIWLMGGGELFRAFLEMHEVDAVEVSIMPALLGGGVRFLPSPSVQSRLKLSSHKIYRSGIASLVYQVTR